MCQWLRLKKFVMANSRNSVPDWLLWHPGEFDSSRDFSFYKPLRRRLPSGNYPPATRRGIVNE